MIDFSQALKNPLDGSDMTEQIKGADGQQRTVLFTLGRACMSALGGGAVNEPMASADEHLRRYILAIKIRNAENEMRPVDLSAEEIVLVKTRLAKSYPQTLVVGQAVYLLDPGAIGSVLMDAVEKKKKAA